MLMSTLVLRSRCQDDHRLHCDLHFDNDALISMLMMIMMLILTLRLILVSRSTIIGCTVTNHVAIMSLCWY